MPATVLSDPLPLRIKAGEKKQKFPWTCSGRFRYNIFLNILIIIVVGLPFFVPTYITLGVNSYFTLLWIIFIILSTSSLLKIRKTMKDNEKSNSVETNTTNELKTIMVTFAYKEPLELILTTLENINQQTLSKSLIVCVALEERTPEKEKKNTEITSKYQDKFSKLLITVHPYGTFGEIPGKCSNSNYAIRSIVRYLSANDANFDPLKYIVTNFDVDTRFHQRFVEIQNSIVSKEKDITSVVWQPILFYNWNLGKTAFFARITGLVRNAFQMGAYLPLNLNIMSVFTASLKLYIDGDYVHPAYQMDDIIAYIRWALMTKKLLKIKPIYWPTISGPTTGANIFQEISEWARQIRRWTIGSAEVFHYFCIKSSRINFWSAFRWGFHYLNYYALLLIAQGILMISTAVYIFLFMDKYDELQNFFIIPMGIVYLLLLIVIVSNKIAVKAILKEVQVVENIPIYREIYSWILSPFVMVCYALVAFYGLVEVMIFGRKVCKHGASKKNNLQEVNTQC